MLAMTIGGVAAGAEEAFDVVNPSTGQVFAQAPACSRHQLDQAMAAIRQRSAAEQQQRDASKKQRPHGPLGHCPL